MDWETARALYQSRCPYRSKFPYREKDKFVEVEVSISDLMPSVSSEEKILKLIDIPEHDPIWVAFMHLDPRIQKYYPGYKLRIVDGNHRTEARRRKGLITTSAYFPQKHYKAYLKMKRNS